MQLTKIRHSQGWFLMKKLEKNLITTNYGIREKIEE